MILLSRENGENARYRIILFATILILFSIAAASIAYFALDNKYSLYAVILEETYYKEDGTIDIEKGNGGTELKEVRYEDIKKMSMADFAKYCLLEKDFTKMLGGEQNYYKDYIQETMNYYTCWDSKNCYIELKKEKKMEKKIQWLADGLNKYSGEEFYYKKDGKQFLVSTDNIDYMQVGYFEKDKLYYTIIPQELGLAAGTEIYKKR